MTDEPTAGPLAGIRVIDVGTRISAPFCAGLLGELGADVIKVELPGEGDFMRTMGPFVHREEGPDYSLSWAVEGRGRRGVTCDLRQPEGKDLFKRLVAQADVLCENFRPAMMERWGLGPEDLPADLVYVRISVFGQSGPYAPRPGLDRLGIAFGGLLNLTGEPDRPPVRPGVTVSDYLTGTFAAVAAVAALYGRDTGGGGGDVVDAPLYGSVLRILEWTLAGYDRLGIVRQREGTGSRTRRHWTTTRPPTASSSVSSPDPTLISGGCARPWTDPSWPPTRASPPWPSAPRGGRDQRPGGRMDLGTDRGGGHGALCRPRRPGRHRLQRGRHLRRPPHAGPGDLVPIEDPVIGTVRQQAPYPRLARHPADVPAGAPRLGEHNRDVWCGLVGLTDAELDDLVARGVV